MRRRGHGCRMPRTWGRLSRITNYGCPAVRFDDHCSRSLQSPLQRLQRKIVAERMRPWCRLLFEFHDEITKPWVTTCRPIALRDCLDCLPVPILVAENHTDASIPALQDRPRPPKKRVPRRWIVPTVWAAPFRHADLQFAVRIVQIVALQLDAQKQEQFRDFLDCPSDLAKRLRDAIGHQIAHRNAAILEVVSIEATYFLLRAVFGSDCLCLRRRPLVVQRFSCVDPTLFVCLRPHLSLTLVVMIESIATDVPRKMHIAPNLGVLAPVVGPTTEDLA